MVAWRVFLLLALVRVSEANNIPIEKVIYSGYLFNTSLVIPELREGDNVEIQIEDLPFITEKERRGNSIHFVGLPKQDENENIEFAVDVPGEFNYTKEIHFIVKELDSTSEGCELFPVLDIVVKRKFNSAWTRKQLIADAKMVSDVTGYPLELMKHLTFDSEFLSFKFQSEIHLRLMAPNNCSQFPNFDVSSNIKRIKQEFDTQELNRKLRATSPYEFASVDYRPEFIEMLKKSDPTSEIIEIPDSSTANATPPTTETTSTTEATSTTKVASTTSTTEATSTTKVTSTTSTTEATSTTETKTAPPTTRSSTGTIFANDRETRILDAIDDEAKRMDDFNALEEEPKTLRATIEAAVAIPLFIIIAVIAVSSAIAVFTIGKMRNIHRKTFVIGNASPEEINDIVVLNTPNV